MVGLALPYGWVGSSAGAWPLRFAVPCTACLERGRPVLGVATVVLPNDELQRTSDGNAAGSPLNSVLDRPIADRCGRRWAVAEAL